MTDVPKPPLSVRTTLFNLPHNPLPFVASAIAMSLSLCKTAGITASQGKIITVTNIEASQSKILNSA